MRAQREHWRAPASEEKIAGKAIKKSKEGSTRGREPRRTGWTGPKNGNSQETRSCGAGIINECY